jgi:hypothetical protein
LLLGRAYGYRSILTLDPQVRDFLGIRGPIDAVAKGMLGDLVEPENGVVAVEGPNGVAAELDELFEESEEAGGFVGFGVELAGRCGLGLQRRTARAAEDVGRRRMGRDAVLPSALGARDDAGD